jgi:hypothetical protein
MAFPKGELKLLPDGRRAFPHITGIGKYFDVSDDTFRRWRKQKEFPEKSEDGWILEEVETWRRTRVRWKQQADKAEKSNGKQSEVDTLKLAVLRNKARKEKLQADAMEGRFVDRALMDRVLVSYIRLVKGKINEWVETLPSQMEGMTTTEMRGLMQSYYDQLCEDMFGVAFVTPATDGDVRTMKDERKIRAGKAQGGKRGRKKK